jgi:branched-chain amino acid transport system ATP-binding protein
MVPANVSVGAVMSEPQQNAHTLLAVRDLVAGYGVPILRGVDITVGAGEIVAVLGANGVGKTTLNKALSGLIAVDSGQIFFDTIDITNAAPPDIVARGLIHVPEGRKIFPNMSVEDNLVLGSYARAKANRAVNLARVYATFPRLIERRRQLAGTLSGGEQQMLAIGRGLMGEPKLLILDEPSLGLAPKLVDDMFELIHTIASQGLAVLLVEQNVVQSLALASRAYVMENGAITMAGASGDLSRDPKLRSAYLGV